MKKRLIISAIIALASLPVYLFLNEIAERERGYNFHVIGGEEMIFIMGAVIIPMLIISHELERRKNSVFLQEKKRLAHNANRSKRKVH